MPINGLPGGDFAGCVQAMRGKMDSPEGFCAWKEHELTGKWPAEESVKAAVPETVTESALHETTPACLTIREATQPNTALMDGVLIIEGLSANRNYYTREALLTAPEVFANKPIRINHPSRTEDKDRPEGDVWTQVGRMPPAENFSLYRRDDGRHEMRFTGAVLSASPPDVWIADRIRAGIIGDMSINAGGEGVREGDGCFRVTRFTQATSHDLVTTAAAGGRAALQESQLPSEGVETMTPDELKKLVDAQIAEALGQVNIVDRVMEAQGLPKEFKPLLEAEAARLKAAGEEAPPAEPEKATEAPADLPEILGQIPDALQTMWGDAYQGCMAGETPDELVCSHQAWLTVCQSLLPGPAPAPETPEEACAPKTEALTAYAQKLKAALVKSPGAGQITGMGSGGGVPLSPATPPKSDFEQAKEAFRMIPGFTEAMAETAARGR